MKEYRSWTYGEAQTGVGSIVSFSCTCDDSEDVKDFIEQRIRSLDTYSTHATNVQHGGYGAYSRYKIVQHKYAGGRGGFIEAIEIINAPDGRNKFVIYCYGSRDGFFSEWETREDLVTAFEKTWGCIEPRRERMRGLKGFKRLVECGALQPWFYAIGDEALCGDYAVSAGLEDDPVYRLGKKFLVHEKDGISVVKTCMGCRYIEESSGDYFGDSSRRKFRYRLVYFDDGTMTRLEMERNDALVPLSDDDAWIADAVRQFHDVLIGKKQGFQLKFADGSTFTGKIAPKGKKAPSIAGEYLVKATHKNGTEEGWVRDFVPTRKHPDIVSYIQSRRPEIQKIQILKCQPKKDGKSWSGVYYTTPKKED